MSSSWKERSRRLARDRFWSEHDRATYECPDCGRTESEVRGPFEVHHKNGEAMDNRPENHVALCRLCHNLREGKKPSVSEIEALRDQLSGVENVACRDDRVHAGNAARQFRELVRQKHPRHTIRTNLVNEGALPEDSLGFQLQNALGFDSIDDVRQIVPRNRREAALVLKGESVRWDALHDAADRMVANEVSCECDLCGGRGDSMHHVRADDHLISGDPDDVSGSAHLCWECLKSEIDG